MILKTNILIGQSGGPTAAINASLAGIISSALKATEIGTIYGARNGIQGVLEEQLIDLSKLFFTEDLIDRLQKTPSMYLGSCRFKLPVQMLQNETYDRIFQVFEKYHIKYFFYIGGNDSMDTVSKLSNYARSRNFSTRIIGVPKTIDNDLMEIDHTPGFGSAAKYIAASLLEMAHDTYIYDLPCVLIAEIMGRNAGWLTAASALARTAYSTAPHLIYLPEKPFSTSSFIRDVKSQLSKRKQVVIAVSEGLRDTHGEYLYAQASRIDQFGHIMLSGTGKYLEGLIVDTIGCKVRSVELNVLQRCSAHIASLTDIEESHALGREAFQAALLGQTGIMATLTRTSDNPYAVEYGTVSVDQVANFEKKIPPHWILPSGNDISQELIDYMRPLTMGESFPSYDKGIPEYLFLPESFPS